MSYGIQSTCIHKKLRLDKGQAVEIDDIRLNGVL